MHKELRPVALLPWLELHQEVKIGRAVFWPYKKMKCRNLPAAYPAHQLDRYAHVFRDANGKLANVTGLSYPAEVGAPLRTAEKAEIRNARYALFAAAYASFLDEPYRHGVYIEPPSAEHFTVFSLPNQERIAEGAWGFDYPRMVTVGPIGEGWEMHPPPHLHRYTCSIFDPILKALDRAVSRRVASSEPLPYVWRALEWFFYAHTTQEHFTEEARLVLLCMAIEAAVKECHGRKDFVHKVGSAVANLQLPKRLRCMRYTNPKGVPCTDKARYNRVEAWASDFYELRKRLVHSKANTGTSVVWRGTGIPVMHYFIASYVWFECLWDTLCKSGVVPPDPLAATNSRTYWRWFHTWHTPIHNMRDWWKDFLTGKTTPP